MAYRLLIAVAALLLSACAGAQQPASPEPVRPLYRYANSSHPDSSPNGMVASQNRWSSAVGAEILAAGGNAVDAAVATGFSLAVTLPRAGNIGGGGFMLLHDARTGEEIAIDFRETAPQRATRDMYLDENGDVDAEKARFSHLSSGVPGTVAGFWHAHQKYGRLPWKRVLEPAIRQAREGILISYDLAKILASNQARYCRNAATCGYFYKPGGALYQPNETLVQSDLADSLEAIAEHGADAFYKGEIAQKIVAEMERGGGLIDAGSLAAYRAVERDVVRGSYRGYEVVSMPPPSSGSVAIVQMLNILEQFPMGKFGAGSADAFHILAEAMRFAYADRSVHLGDPDFYDVPVGWLTSKSYARELAAKIDPARAKKSTDIAPGVEPADESFDTTHISVIDADGSVSLITYTINFSFGSGVAVPGAGFVLNNEMVDFVAKPGVANAFGLVGDEANAIAAGKRPLSSMTPVIVFDDDKPVIATGSPGGSVIITTVLQLIVNVIDHGMNLAEATAAPRIHHQWYPDALMVEPGISPDTIRALEAKGHTVDSRGFMMGSLQSVGYRDGAFRGASDTRRPNAAAIAPGNSQSQ
jgi:gamma-glutamyltranspeptidase/glutathione hydrolase